MTKLEKTVFYMGQNNLGSETEVINFVSTLEKFIGEGTGTLLSVSNHIFSFSSFWCFYQVYKV